MELPAPIIIRDVNLTSENDMCFNINNANNGCTHVYKIPQIGDYIYNFTWSFQKQVHLFDILMNNWHSLSLANDLNLISIELVLDQPTNILSRINNPFQKSVNLLSGNIMQYNIDFTNNMPLLLSAMPKNNLFIIFNFSKPPSQPYHIEYKIGFTSEPPPHTIKIYQQIQYQLDNIFYAVTNQYYDGNLVCSI